MTLKSGQIRNELLRMESALDKTDYEVPLALSVTNEKL